MIKDFNLYDEKCGTCLTIGYIASAAVAALLAGLIGGSTITEIILFVVAAVVLGYAANRYCMGKVTDEAAEEDFNATAKALATRVEAAVESVMDAAPTAAEVKGRVENTVGKVREAASGAVEGISDAVESKGKHVKPAAPTDDRSAAMEAARATAEAEVAAKQAMADAVAALEAKKKG